MSEETKPNGLTEEHLNFLDDLRHSGVINMFGAAPYLETEFELDRKTARAYLSYWMITFSKRHPIPGLK